MKMCTINNTKTTVWHGTATDGGRVAERSSGLGHGESATVVSAALWQLGLLGVRFDGPPQRQTPSLYHRLCIAAPEVHST